MHGAGCGSVGVPPHRHVPTRWSPFCWICHCSISLANVGKYLRGTTTRNSSGEWASGKTLWLQPAAVPRPRCTGFLPLWASTRIVVGMWVIKYSRKMISNPVILLDVCQESRAWCDTISGGDRAAGGLVTPRMLQITGTRLRCSLGNDDERAVHRCPLCCCCCEPLAMRHCTSVYCVVYCDCTAPSTAIHHHYKLTCYSLLKGHGVTHWRWPCRHAASRRCIRGENCERHVCVLPHHAPFSRLGIIMSGTQWPVARWHWRSVSTQVVSAYTECGMHMHACMLVVPLPSMCAASSPRRQPLQAHACV